MADINLLSNGFIVIRILSSDVGEQEKELLIMLGSHLNSLNTNNELSSSFNSINK